MNKFLILFLLLILGLSGCKTSTEDPFALIWQFEYTKAAESLSLLNTNPHVVYGNILIAPDEQFSLINSDNGNAIWQTELEGSPDISVERFLIDGNDLFAKEDQTHNLYKINLSDGEVLWQVDASAYAFFQQSNDALDEQYLYLLGDRYEILVFTKQGAFEKSIPLSKFGREVDARSIYIKNNQLIFSQFWLEDSEQGSIETGRILSIDKETEEVLWEYRTDNGGFIFEPILLENEIIYAGVTDGPGEFVALNANNGEVIWKTLGIIGQSYTLTDSMVLVNGGVSLYALDKFTGKELWNTGLEFGGGDGASNIGYLNGFVYHAHSGRLYILEGNTGKIVHTEERSPDGSPFQLLAVGNDRVFIQTFNALYAYTAWE